MIFETQAQLVAFLNAEDEVTRKGFDTYTDSMKRDAEKAAVIAFRQSMTLELIDQAPPIATT